MPWHLCIVIWSIEAEDTEIAEKSRPQPKRPQSRHLVIRIPEVSEASLCGGTTPGEVGGRRLVGREAIQTRWRFGPLSLQLSCDDAGSAFAYTNGTPGRRRRKICRQGFFGFPDLRGLARRLGPDCSLTSPSLSLLSGMGVRLRSKIVLCWIANCAPAARFQPSPILVTIDSPAVTQLGCNLVKVCRPPVGISTGAQHDGWLRSKSLLPPLLVPVLMACCAERTSHGGGLQHPPVWDHGGPLR